MTSVHEMIGRDALTAFERGVKCALRRKPAYKRDVFEPTNATTQHFLGILHPVPVD